MHTSFKNVLSRTFRQPGPAPAGYFTVAAWLVPAAAADARHPQRRHFSRTRQRCAHPPDPHRDPPDAAQSVCPPSRRPRFPQHPSAEAVEAWVDCLEPLLPPHLSRASSGTPEPPNIGAERLESAKAIALCLALSRKHDGVDILSYLAIQQGRWDAVMWLLKTVIEIPIPEEKRVEDIPLSAARVWDGIHGSLELATQRPLALRRVASTQPFTQNLDQLTNPKKFGEGGSSYRNGALGQIWRSLGNMILIAVGDRPQEKDEILGHVLELLAYLHHADIIPESVYHYDPPKDKYSLQQPPTLYLLSSKILSALSDAAWRAHELAAASENKTQAQYTIFGQEIPGSRYKIRTPELGPEVWLELVLWSCLHGKWTVDGAAILKKLTGYKDDLRWSVLHWKNVLHDRSGSSFRTMTWTDLWSFARARGTQARSPERFMVDRTISSEVVAAYIDGLLNRIMAGVVDAGVPVADIFRDITTFKALLDRDNLGLGTATWESTIARFMESGGIDPDIEARWLERLSSFSSSFDQELDYQNAAREYEDSPGSPSYILDPSSISLGVLHQALRINITNGNLTGALRVVSQLQSVTDQNKRRSIQKFFEKLNSPSEGGSAPKPFSSNIHPRDYPTYFPQIPPTLLAGILDLATQTRAYDVATRLLYSDDIDGPLIPLELYEHSDIAAAITKYAYAVDDADLLVRVTSLQSERGGIAPQTSWAILEIQMQRQQWDTVENVVHNLAMHHREARVANVGALIARQLLILQDRVLKQDERVTETHPLAKAASIFRRLIKARFGSGDKERYHRFHGILCVLSTIGPEWHEFCSRLFVYRGTKSLERCVKEEDFAQLLQGVTETRGAHNGMELMAKWCEDVSVAPHLERKHYMQNAEREVRWELRVEEIIVEGKDGSELILRGRRLSPTLPLMRTVYRAALRQIKENPTLAWEKQRVRSVLSWALTGLRAMGLTTKEIWYELDGITRGFELWDRAKTEHRKRKRPSNRKARVAKRANKASDGSVKAELTRRAEGKEKGQ
ncbi:c6 transcription factor [Diplodia corticola]|uniref:C6 transcription factor n=1 Tax=Diplodia corticola TaxID=236234 RepID=A0A1J9RGV2_9PEZI|nr:c6 transcription factor [Diplodia corticola]OJD39824.1 c6 transcription factor [Diplodia corticola]